MTAPAPPCTKTRYPTLTDVERALLRCAENRWVRHRHHRREADFYLCRRCRGWHTTSMVTHPDNLVVHGVERMVAERQRECDGCARIIPAGSEFVRHSFEIGEQASLLDECLGCRAVAR